MRIPWRLLLFVVVIAYLGALVLVPIFAIVARVVNSGLDVVIADLLRPDALHAIKLTAILSLLAVVVNGLFGVLAALVLVRQRFWGRKILDTLVDLPLTVSPVMTGFAFLLIFGRQGWLETPLEFLGWKITFAFPGLVVATLFVTLPFTLREVAGVLEEVGTTDEEAAVTLGASPWKTFWYVTLPNIKHGLACGITLTLARALGEFGAVLILGGAISGKTQTATTFIYAATEERKEGAAFGMALVLALVSMAVLGLLEWLKAPRNVKN
jgi:sulfate/thiosulfate transport system permease protein